MDIKPIKTDADYRVALKEIESLIEEHYHELINAWQSHFSS